MTPDAKDKDVWNEAMRIMREKLEKVMTRQFGLEIPEEKREQPTPSGEEILDEVYGQLRKHHQTRMIQRAWTEPAKYIVLVNADQATHMVSELEKKGVLDNSPEIQGVEWLDENNMLIMRRIEDPPETFDFRGVG